jgi:hypothetical protein
LSFDHPQAELLSERFHQLREFALTEPEEKSRRRRGDFSGAKWPIAFDRRYTTGRGL